MAINITNTTGGEQFNFLANQSSILRSTDTNKIKVNGVNVIVSKPKKGDIMCVKDRKVIWIDGLSINPKQLSQEIEPVGICVAINGNKAMVRYRKEGYMRWAASERWELPYDRIMNDNASHSLSITLNGATYDNLFTYTASTRLQFVERLNEWFRANNSNYSAELVEPNTDLPATDTSDTKVGTNTFKNRIIINAKFTANAWNTISISGIGKPVRAIGKHIKVVNYCYRKNGFTVYLPVCCKAKCYDYVQANQLAPTVPMTTINVVPNDDKNKKYLPARLIDFKDNPNCQILRDNFSSYDEYFDSMTAKQPCNKGGSIAEFPSGKEDTYKLADCTFINNETDNRDYLYPAAHYAASINVDVPGLEAGNWWLPSSAEMVQMMSDITYETTLWETNPDIVNTVLDKMVKFDDTKWTMLSTTASQWTSSMCAITNAYSPGIAGVLGNGSLYFHFMVAPITIYEF